MILDPYHDVHSQCHHVIHRPSAIPGHHLTHADSIRSETSLEDSALGRSICRDSCATANHTSPHAPKEASQYKIIEVEPDAIQVIGDAELQQLPEAVNREILKNSREIVYEDDQHHDHRESNRDFNHRDLNQRDCHHRDFSHRDYNHKELNHREHDLKEETLLIPKPVLTTNRRNFRYPLLEEERRSLNGSRRNLSHRNLLISEDDRRSLNGSRRNLNGSKKYFLLALDKSDSHRNLYVGSRENLIGSRRHTGSKEMLNGIRRNVVGIKGSKETPELRPRRKTNEMIIDGRDYEVEKTFKKSGRPLQEIVVHRSERSSPLQESLEANSSPNSRLELAFSRDSDLLNESDSVENIKNERRLSNSSVNARNRRSYEHAQLQDVNKIIPRPNSGSSSSDSDSTSRTVSSSGVPGKQSPSSRKPIPYTSV